MQITFNLFLNNSRFYMSTKITKDNKIIIDAYTAKLLNLTLHSMF